MNKLNFTRIGWVVVILFIAANTIILINIKAGKSSYKKPFNQIKLNKPTLLVIFKELECQTCIENLFVLNEVYENINGEGILDINGLVLSKENTDRKNIARQFDFPFFISNDFAILKRLNIDRTPLLIGLSKDHKIFYSETVPNGTIITYEYLKKGVLNRLYYSDIIGNKE